MGQLHPIDNSTDMPAQPFPQAASVDISSPIPGDVFQRCTKRGFLFLSRFDDLFHNARCPPEPFHPGGNQSSQLRGVGVIFEDFFPGSAWSRLPTGLLDDVSVAEN